MILREKCHDLGRRAAGGWLVGPPLKLFFLFISIIFDAIFSLMRPAAVAHDE
jgi:hypothetical protein